MADLISMLSACGQTEGLPTDPDFQNVTLLLHGDGTNGAQNNTFLDSSTNNFTITRNGNTTQGTFTPFSKVDGRWGTYYDGTDDYLSVADNAVLRPGAGAFTLEAWIYRNAAGVAHTIYAKGGASTGISFLVTSGNVLRFTHTTTNIDSSGTVAANAWVHVAVVREGTGTNQTKLYINGTQDGQGTVSTDFTQTEEVRIGTNRGATDDFAGYISNVRFVKGSALYTGNFTPSTSPFTTTSQGASSSEVELLTCQSNRFIDNSSNNFTITRNGDVKVTPFSPFPTLTAYDPATNGGSGYFDGSGDYLTVPDNAAFDFSGAFTIECWLYLTANNNASLIDTRLSSNNGYVLTPRSDGTIELDRNDVNILNGTIVRPLNAWSHVVIVRNASDNLSMFINGVRDVTTTYSSSFDSSTTVHIGAKALAISGLVPITGYLSNLRVVKGTAVYDPTQTTITVPTSPLTAITNTSLLLNFTNAGIIDNSMSNNLETVGDAQIDTTTKKYGTGAMKFDGNGDNLTIRSNDTLWLGSGQFTIEMWLYPNDASSQQMLLSGSDTGSIFLGMNIDGANRIALGRKGVAVDNFVSYTYSTGAWIHLAVTRDSSNNVRFFVGGTQVGSTGSNSNSFTNSALNIGFEPTQKYLNGYIDDLRITKGIARYTSAFTPPTAAFPDIGD